jgi:hypothetical protein
VTPPQLLASPSEALREQCVMGLGNIAADSASSRDKLIALHAAPAIASQVCDAPPPRPLFLVHRTPASHLTFTR